MPRIKICKEEGCHNSQTTSGYCRLHYLKNWKRLKAEVQERAAKRLNRYVEFICKQHPDRYVDVIKENLRSKNFEKTTDDRFHEVDDLYNLFNEPTYEEDIERLIHDLKIEKEF